MLPIIDDIDGTPMRTTYKIIFGSTNKTNWYYEGNTCIIVSAS
jgi:hypothetical protein